MKHIIQLLIWGFLSGICYATSAEVTPKECSFGTPDYNVALCNETCTKDIHMHQAYCTNFSLTTATIVATTIAAPEIHHQKEVTGISLVPQEIMKDIDITVPPDDNNLPSGTSSSFSLFLSVLCLLFSFLIHVLL